MIKIIGVAFSAWDHKTLGRGRLSFREKRSSLDVEWLLLLSERERDSRHFGALFHSLKTLTGVQMVRFLKRIYKRSVYSLFIYLFWIFFKVSYLWEQGFTLVECKRINNKEKEKAIETGKINWKKHYSFYFSFKDCRRQWKIFVASSILLCEGSVH